MKIGSSITFMLFSVLLAGGFHIWCSTVLSIVLGICILFILKRQEQLIVYVNWSSVAVTAILVSYICSVNWSVDRGMAAFGAVHFLPVFLFLLLATQMDGNQIDRMYMSIPWIGAAITILCWVMQFVPVINNYVTINGRLTGTFQYANTYALFLLVGCCVLLFQTKPDNRNQKCIGQQKETKFISGRFESDPFLFLFLVFGIMASGSRTTILLLALIVTVFICIRRDILAVITVGGMILAAVLISFVIAKSGILESGRTLEEAASPGTLYCRLLYYKDALPVIVKHPFGLGYLGYFTLQTSFQTGVYSVRYVHNGLLQLLLDVGWIPAMLMCASIIMSFFHRGKSIMERMVLLVIAAHAMMDFDLQYMSIWFLLLLAMELRNGREIILRSRIGIILFCIVSIAVSGWMGFGDGLYQFGNREACLRVTPFYTYAWRDVVKESSSLETMEQAADRILSLSDYVPDAHSVKGDACLAKGEIRTMISEKERAIQLAPFCANGYLDYMDKLYALMQHYLEVGDLSSAAACRQRILQIPELMLSVKSGADPLAWKIEHKPELDLPSEYQDMIQSLR